MKIVSMWTMYTFLGGVGHAFLHKYWVLWDDFWWSRIFWQQQSTEQQFYLFKNAIGPVVDAFTDFMRENAQSGDIKIQSPLIWNILLSLG